LFPIKPSPEQPVCIGVTGYFDFYFTKHFKRIIMKITFIIAVVALLSISAISATAQNNLSLHDESLRIHQGVASGQLTAFEAARLNTEKAMLREEAARYKANDGRIGPRERADLRRDNRRFSANICRQKHDRQRRF